MLSAPHSAGPVITSAQRREAKKGTRPRALTAEALPPPYGIAYDARPPTVDLISPSSSLSFRLCLSLSDVFAHVPVTLT